MKELENIVRALLTPGAGSSVLATLVSVEGSSYRRPGARLLLQEDGTRTGSVSGGCLEEDVLARAREVTKTGQPEAVVYDTTSENDLVWGVGLGCHGIVRVVLEKLPPRPAWATALAENFTVRRPTLLAVRHRPGAEANGTLGTRLIEPVDGTAPVASETDVFLERVSPPTALFIYGAGDD